MTGFFTRLWRRFFPAPHVHDWFVFFQQSSGVDGLEPSVHIADCACGARAKVYTSPLGLPDIRIEAPDPGGSAANVLFDNAKSLLGHPQNAHLQLLIDKG